MPVVKDTRFDGVRMVVWAITEREIDLRQAVNLLDLVSVVSIKSVQRRRERLAWRAALRFALQGEDVDAQVIYDSVGVPSLLDGRFLAVSHCEGLAVVVIAERRCSVDVERCDRNLKRLTKRYISPTEQMVVGCGNELFEVAMWCGKETLYKYSGRRELDFIRDLEVFEIDFVKQQMTGRILKQEPLKISFMVTKGCLVTYI